MVAHPNRSIVLSESRAPGGGLAASLVAMVVVAACSASASAGGAFTENFANDPVANGRGSIVGSAGDFTFAPGKVTSHYNANSATSKLVLPIGATIDQNTPFTMTVHFTIDSITGNVNDNTSELGNSQIAFGLSNSVSTLENRTGFGSQDAYNLLTVDYFPTINKYSGNKPSLGPTLVETKNAAAQYYEQVDFAFGPASQIDHFLATGVALTATTTYDPVTHVLSTTIEAASPLWSGGPTSVTLTNDLDASALIYDTYGFGSFAVDQLGIYNWDDTGNILWGLDGAYTADVSYTSMSVTWGDPVPEPATLSILAVGGAALLARRRRD